MDGRVIAGVLILNCQQDGFDLGQSCRISQRNNKCCVASTAAGRSRNPSRRSIQLQHISGNAVGQRHGDAAGTEDSCTEDLGVAAVAGFSQVQVSQRARIEQRNRVDRGGGTGACVFSHTGAGGCVGQRGRVILRIDRSSQSTGGRPDTGLIGKGCADVTVCTEYLRRIRHTHCQTPRCAVVVGHIGQKAQAGGGRQNQRGSTGGGRAAAVNRCPAATVVVLPYSLRC